MDNLNIKHILSEEFQNLTEFALKEKKNYLTAKPFPNIALNNFFNNDFLNTILNEFPDLSKLHGSQNYNVKNEIKLSNKNYDKFPTTIKSFIDFLNSDTFLLFLQNFVISFLIISDFKSELGNVKIKLVFFAYAFLFFFE